MFPKILIISFVILTTSQLYSECFQKFSYCIDVTLLYATYIAQTERKKQYFFLIYKQRFPLFLYPSQTSFLLTFYFDY